MSTSRRRTAFILAATFLAGCDSPTANSRAAAPDGNARPALIATATSLGGEIVNLVNTGFPKGEATAILAKWNTVLRSLDRAPKETLKGKTVPPSQGRSELSRTLSYLKLKTSAATPPAGESRDHFVARIALDMSTYVYGGDTAPVPPMTTTSDVAFDVVQPASTPDTVVTPAKQAGVVFPANAVSEPTVVVISPDTGYYPANCSGPLTTSLCQYPRFYHFHVFPDVKLNSPARVQVCHVDAGSVRMPLADHDRFRVAHPKPASPADYSAGSTIVDNIEILAFAVIDVTNCTANGGTTYNTASVWRRGFERLASILSPKEAWAIDVGGGGFAEEFSPFAVVDPQSKSDLAQSTTAGSRFSLSSATATAGGTIAVPGWAVTNAGSGTSGAFTSNVIIATDTALTAVVTTVPVGGGASLVPRSSYTYPAMTLSAPTAAGTYFVGTRIVPVGSDSTTADDWTSVRITVSTIVLAGPPPNQYSLDSGATYATGTSGGAGGSPYTISCPAGSVATGVIGQTGSYYGWASVFNAGLQCAPLLANGSLGTPMTTATAGLFSGGTAFLGSCTGGLLVGGTGHTTGSSMVADLTGLCAGLATIVAHGAPTSTIGPWIGSGVNYLAPFALQCNPGDVITGLNGRSGDILDAIGFLCTPVIHSTGS